MTFKQKFSCLIIAITISISHNIKAENIVVSIPPLYLIANDLVKQTSINTKFLVNQDPHHFFLKPSQIREIKNAKAVFFISTELEHFLEKTLKTSDNSNIYELIKIKNLTLHRIENNQIDPHIWLNTENALKIAHFMAEKMARLFPQEKNKINDNYDRFKSDIKALNKKIRRQLSKLKDLPYAVLHDAYGYFEEQFDMHSTIHITDIHDNPVGISTFSDIISRLRQEKIKCLFVPRLPPSKLAQTIEARTNITILTLDPIATNKPISERNYAWLIDNLAKSFIDCSRL